MSIVSIDCVHVRVNEKKWQVCGLNNTLCQGGCCCADKKSKKTDNIEKIKEGVNVKIIRKGIIEMDDFDLQKNLMDIDWIHRDKNILKILQRMSKHEPMDTLEDLVYKMQRILNPINTVDDIDYIHTYGVEKKDIDYIEHTLSKYDDAEFLNYTKDITILAKDLSLSFFINTVVEFDIKFYPMEPYRFMIRPICSDCENLEYNTDLIFRYDFPNDVGGFDYYLTFEGETKLKYYCGVINDLDVISIKKDDEGQSFIFTMSCIKEPILLYECVNERCETLMKLLENQTTESDDLLTYLQTRHEFNIQRYNLLKENAEFMIKHGIGLRDIDIAPALIFLTEDAELMSLSYTVRNMMMRFEMMHAYERLIPNPSI